MPACMLLFIATLLLVAGILLGVSAGRAGHQDHAFGVVVAATVIVLLLVLGACVSGCRLWLEQPAIIDDEPRELGPVSGWRLGCYALGALLATVALVLVFVGLGQLGDVYGEYVAATVLTALAWVFVVAIGLYFCYETYR